MPADKKPDESAKGTNPCKGPMRHAARRTAGPWHFRSVASA